MKKKGGGKYLPYLNLAHYSNTSINYFWPKANIAVLARVNRKLFKCWLYRVCVCQNQNEPKTGLRICVWELSRSSFFIFLFSQNWNISIYCGLLWGVFPGKNNVQVVEFTQEVIKAVQDLCSVEVKIDILMFRVRNLRPSARIHWQWNFARIRGFSPYNFVW